MKVEFYKTLQIKVMNKTINIFLSVTMFFLMVGCGGDEPTSGKGNLEIVVQGIYGSSPFVKGMSYDYFGKGNILFTKSEWFVSSLGLIGTHHNHTIKDVDYWSLSDHHTSLEKAQEGMLISYLDIPTGTYTGFQFDLGLNPTLNKTVPANYSPVHPMGEGSRYWAAWNSYIFSKTEGSYNDGSKSYNFTYHSGFDDSMKHLEWTKNIVIASGQTTRLILQIDHQALFGEDIDGMDIASNPQIHNKSTVLDAFMNRFKASIQLK